ncbi:MAG: hypothetical protein NVS9B2_30140 [Steroidobacteraceae bacterium]
MAIEHQNVKLYAGEYKVLTFTITDSNNALLDLTGAAVRWVLTGPGSRTGVVLLKSGVVLNQTTLTGQCTVTLVQADTATLTVGTYQHQCEITDIAGHGAVVATGDLTLAYNAALYQ